MGSELDLDDVSATSPAAARHWAAIKAMVDEQAEDWGLWFEARTASETYLQQELRRLHAMIEDGPGQS